MRTKNAKINITKINTFVPQLLLAGSWDCVGVGVGSVGVITLGAEKLNVNDPCKGTSPSE
jgi:hypothetical protein